MLPVNNAFGSFNNMRPSNQLVLLLQKGHDFPMFPVELNGTIDEKTWYKRMDELKPALLRYWSWVEKALFAFGFIASVTIPWPIIAAATRFIDDNEQGMNGNNTTAYTTDRLANATSTIGEALSSIGRATSTAVTSNLSSVTDATPTSGRASSAALATGTITSAAARMLVRRGLEPLTTVLGIDGNPYDLYDDDWAGQSNWSDSYSSQLRWAAIGSLIGIVMLVWLPWVAVTVRNTKRLRRLVNSWNIEDEKLGPMRSLTWSLDKASAFSNAKLLVIGLPAGYNQMPSIFHANAYPPIYGFGMPAAVLPDYHENGYRYYGNDKESSPVATQRFHTIGDETPSFPGGQPYSNTAETVLPPAPASTPALAHQRSLSTAVDKTADLEAGHEAADERPVNRTRASLIFERRMSDPNRDEVLQDSSTKADRRSRTSSKSSV